MALPVLQSKLFVPPVRPALVPRPRLVSRLNEGLHRKLSLLSAPAGFGKTTLVSEWVTGIERPTAWLSLDEGDSDPTRFLTYLVAALQTLVLRGAGGVAVPVGEGLLGTLHSSQPSEAILTTLVNEISTLSDRFVLVLDDYHLTDAEPVDGALTFLLEHLPSQMHLVLATREDPLLPLARLRARGQMTELRAADLRFTAAEAAEFLSRVMNLHLAADDIAALEERTEGWIAGLQLAALSMQGHEDIPGFIQAFTGDHRYIVDYLVEEVLEQQPAAIRNFLLQTAILERMSGPLCDAVTGQEEGSARLQALERGNFFVVPLDDTRHWYRYHQLFADVLSVRLMAEQPDRVATLHRRASAWYEHNGSVADAIHHALAATDFVRAAGLIERTWPEMRRRRQEATALAWLRTLPEEVLECMPVLNVEYAHMLLASGVLDGVEERLRAAEQWLAPTTDLKGVPQAAGTRPAATMIVVNQEEFRRLPGRIAIARTGLALARGDGPGAVDFARRALAVAPEDDPLTRGSAAAFLGLIAWTKGDLDDAHHLYADGMASLQQAGNISDAIHGAVTLASVRIAQGRLREAMRTYERGLALATGDQSEGGFPSVRPILRGAADMHVGISELLRERNDLHAATQHLLASKALGEHTGFPQYRYRRRVAMARLQEAQGDLDGALDLLHEAERLYMADFSPNVRPVAALVTRVWIVQGRLAEALGWAREHGLSAHDDLSYLREFEHITLARLLLAQYRSEQAGRFILEATALLERLLQAAEDGDRAGSVIEILVVQALIHQAMGNLPGALVPLERALRLAEPEGYVRLFVDEGAPMAMLLEAALSKGIVPAFVRHLLTASGKPEDRATANQQLIAKRAHSAIEPLSERELDVLRLLATDLSGPELARELMVSLSTIRTHTSHIYSKLGVNNRRAAVRRAEELALL